MLSTINKKTINTLFLLLFLSIPVAMASPGTDWLASHAQADGSVQNVGSPALATELQATAEALSTWLHFSEASRPEWTTGLNYLEVNHVGSTEELANLFIIKSLHGVHDQLLLDELLGRVNADGGVGPAAGYESNVLDTSFLLRALAQASSDEALVLPLLTYLTLMDNADGGYALTQGQESSVYLSALAVKALTPYQSLSLDVINQVQSTNTYLVQQQASNGGWGETFLSALAITALVQSNHPYIDYYPSILQLRDSKQNNQHWDDDVYVTALALVAEDLTADFADPSTSGTISGVVISSVDQQPLAGVSVVRDGFSFTEVFTNSLGQYSMSQVNAAAHTLVFNSPGYTQGDLSFTIEEGDALNLGTITLVKTPDSGIIKGTVVYQSTGDPIYNAQVEVVSNGSTYQANTNRDGLYQMAIPAGPFDVSVSYTNLNKAVASGVLALNQTIEFSPALSNSSVGVNETQVSGRLIDANSGLPISGVDIQVVAEGVQVFSDTNGTFLLEQLSLGSIQLVFSQAGYQVLTIDLLSGGGLINLMDIGMTPVNVVNQSTLIGVVTESGTVDAIQGVQVDILNTALAVVTDASGAYVVEGIPNENYVVQFTAPGYEPLQFQVTGTQHGTTELNVQLTQAGSSPLQILEFLPDRYEFTGAEEVELDIEIQNASHQLLSTRLYLKVINADDQVVAYYPVKEVPHGGTVLDASETLDAFERRALMEFWNTRFQEPGEYRIELLAFDENSQNLLRQASTVITILPVKVVTGTVDFSPNVTQFDPSEEIQITADVVNSGNAPIGQVDVTAAVYLVDKKNNSEQLTATVTDVYADPLLDSANMIRVDSLGDLVIYSTHNDQFARFKSDESFEALFTKHNVFDFHLDDNDLIWTIDFSCQLEAYDVTGNNVSTFNLALSSCRDFEILNDNENFYVVSAQGVYNFNKNTQQLDLEIGNLLEDPQDAIKHSDGRLIIADGNTGSLLAYQNGQLSVWVEGLSDPHGLAEDVDGTILVANYGANEIIRVDALGQQSVVNNTIITPYDIDINPQGGYFVSAETENKLYQLNNNGTASVIYDSFINVPRVITQGPAGEVYIYNSTDQTIIRRLPDGTANTVTTTPGVVTAMHVDGSNQLIIAMSSRLHRVANDGSITELSNSNSPSISLITDGDVAGAYWFSSYDGIISQMNVAGDVTHDAFVTPFTSVKAVRSNSLGEVIVLDAGGSLTQFDETGTYNRFAEVSGSVLGLSLSSSDVVYVSKSDRTIYAIDNLGNQTAYMTVDNPAQKFAIDSNGDVFYTTRGTAVYHDDGVTETVFATLNYAATGDFVVDHMDRLWISHPSNAKVSVVDSSGVVTEIDTTGVIGPNSIDLIDGTDSAWLAHREGYFKLNLMGQVTDIMVSNEVSRTYSVELVVSNNAFFLMQRGVAYQYDVNGLLTKNMGTFGRVLDMFKRDGALYLLTQTPNRRVLKYLNNTTLADVIYEQPLYAMEPGVDADHLYANTFYETVEVDLLNQTQQVIIDDVNGSQEKLSVSGGKLHLINHLDNLYRVYDASGAQELNLFGLDNAQGLAVADDGYLYITDDANVYRFDGSGMAIIEETYVGSYIHHHANTLFKASPSGTQLFTYNTLTGDEDVRSFDSVSQLKSVVYESDQNIKLVTARGLAQLGLDGTETLLVGSLSHITDVLQRQNGTVLFASSEGSSQGGISQYAGGVLTDFYTNQDLLGVIPTALTETGGVVYAWSDVSVVNHLLKIDAAPRKINNPLALDYQDRMLSVVVKDGFVYGVNFGDVLFKSQLADPLDQLPLIGDLVYSDTVSVDFSLGHQSLNFTSFNAPIAGEYSVGLTFSDAAVNADINDSLFVGNVATGLIQLASLNVAPGDAVLDTHMLIDGLDLQKTVNVVSEEAEEVMFYDGNLQALTNYVLADDDTIIYTEGNNDQVKKYDRISGTHSLMFTNSRGVTDIKKDHNNQVFLVNSPTTGQIQWIDKNGQSLQVKDMVALYNFPTILYADYNSAGHMLVLGKFNGNDYSILEIDHSTDTIVDRWDNVPVETNMWVTSNDNVYLIGAAITEINLQQNRATQLRDHINREPGESNRNGVAVCEDTVIFSDPIIGEEEELYAGAVRKDLVYHGDNTDLFPNQNATYVADFESLMFDKEFSSLVLFDHLLSVTGGPGRILKVPVTCGQMYVEVVLRDRADTALLGFDVAPNQIIQVADEIKEYRWVINELDEIQQIFAFQFQVDDLLPNESRPVLSAAYINFRSDLDPQQELINPIPIPVLLGVPDRTVQVALDDSSYPAQTDVMISNTVNNTATIVFDGSLVQHIEDSQGRLVQSLGVTEVNGLLGSAQQMTNSTWNTSNFLAGDYQLVSQLFDELGDLQDEQITPFSIAVDANNHFNVSFNALTDQAQYDQNDTVEIAATLTNEASNALLENTRLEWIITAPDNSVLLQQTGPVSTLAPGASQQWQELLLLDQAVVGTYTITFHLRGAADVILQSFVFTFEVVNNTQLSFLGQVSVDFTDIQPGTDNVCHFELSNQSNQMINGQEVVLMVVNLSSQLTVQSTNQVIDLQAGGTWQHDLLVPTNTLSSGDHACLIRTVVNTEATTQASAVFTVTGANQLSGQVFDDFNGDGQLDVQDVGIENVMVSLLDEGSNVVQSVNTTATGHYQFAPIFNGQYQVVVDETAVLSSASMTTANNNLVLMVENGHVVNDFGYQFSDSSVQGTIWDDANDDGQVGLDESGFEHVTLRLVDASQHEVATSTTNADGLFQFNDVSSGSYQLEITDEQLLLDGLRNTTNNEPMGLDVFSHSDLIGHNFGYRLDVFDLDVFTTNCTQALYEGQAITYFVQVKNPGNTDIQQALVENLIPAGLSDVNWSCSTSGGASCGGSGMGDITDQIDIPQGGEVNYQVTATVTGQLLEIITNEANVTMPVGIEDSDMSNNQALDSDLILDLFFIDGFECAAPALPAAKQAQLMDMLISQQTNQQRLQLISYINQQISGTAK